MWLLFAVIHAFLLALVNYTDEYLATNNKLPLTSTIHTKVGSVLLISTLMSFVGAGLIFLFNQDIFIATQARNLAMLSAIPMVAIYALYFYILQKYPVHLIAPLWLFSSVWLLGMEVIFGTSSITVQGILGIALMLYGAFILDAGTFKWKIPTRLALIMIPASSLWAIVLFMVRTAAQLDTSTAITFWQMLTIGGIGVALLFVKVYREGFMYRIKNQGKVFLGLSAANETFGEMGYLFSNLAVAVAPVAAYVSAMAGVQSVFVLVLFLLFPQGKRAKITPLQVIAVILITLGVFCIEQR